MTPTSFSLEGKTALVTGGATGIGAAVAIAFAQAGANIALTVHNRPADEVIHTIDALNRHCLPLAYDLSELTPERANALFADIEQELAPVDILVNNAGIIRRAPAVDFTYEDWQAVMQVNLEAVWLLSQAAGSHMQTRGGKIITIASVLSFQGGMFVPAYTAAKHAVTGLTKALANEWASHGINVNAIAPGYIRTANTRALQNDAERSQALLARIPAGRWGEPSDLGGAAVFLASDAANYVHGTTLAVDGGWLAR
jgi:2-deoxy-D-gluconate 3-dehydrogenase